MQPSLSIVKGGKCFETVSLHGNGDCPDFGASVQGSNFESALPSGFVHLNKSFVSFQLIQPSSFQAMQGEDRAEWHSQDYNVWHSHKTYEPFYDIKYFILPVTFEGLSVVFSLLILFPWDLFYPVSDDISGKLGLLCGNHYSLKSES